MEWQLVLVLALVMVMVALGNYADVASEDGELIPRSKRTAQPKALSAASRDLRSVGFVTALEFRAFGSYSGPNATTATACQQEAGPTNSYGLIRNGSAAGLTSLITDAWKFRGDRCPVRAGP